MANSPKHLDNGRVPLYNQGSRGAYRYPKRIDVDSQSWPDEPLDTDPGSWYDHNTDYE